MKKISFSLIALLLFIANNSIAQVSTNFNSERSISSKGRFDKNYFSDIDFIM
jgi:hypothetical protein